MVPCSLETHGLTKKNICTNNTLFCLRWHMDSLNRVQSPRSYLTSLTCRTPRKIIASVHTVQSTSIRFLNEFRILNAYSCKCSTVTPIISSCTSSSSASMQTVWGTNMTFLSALPSFQLRLDVQEALSLFLIMLYQQDLQKHTSSETAHSEQLPVFVYTVDILTGH